MAPIKEIPLEEILVENSTYLNTWRLKKKLVKVGLLEDKCIVCSQGNGWNGKPLSLHLDHINGINNDHRLENLRILCPNCHSQTETYAGKKTKISYACVQCNTPISKTGSKSSGLCKSCAQRKRQKADRPSIEQLLKDVVETSYVATGKKYGVSDNAIRKWIRLYQTMGV